MDNTYRATIDERMEKEKRAVLDALKKMPIVEVACQKTGVGTTTYYRWRQNDKEFLRESEVAFAEGKAFLIDLARTQMVSLVKNKQHWPAIKRILDNSGEDFISSKGRAGRSLVEFEELSPEQENIVKAALQKVRPRKIRKTWRRKQKPKIKIKNLPKSDPSPKELSVAEQLERLSQGKV